VISSFRSKETERVFRRECSRSFDAIARVAKRKLDQLHAATSLADLAAVPGNRLEELVGDRAGQHSIRINNQWRIYFEWKDNEACVVEIVDYHEAGGRLLGRPGTPLRVRTDGAPAGDSSVFRRLQPNS